MRRIVRFSALGLMASLLAACQAVNYGPPPMVQVQPQRGGIEGEWVDPNGIISSFRGGTFETRTTDTNSLLASGNYQMVSDRLVQIDLTSRVRGTQSTVNCAIVSPSQLNCTSNAGDQFSLGRRA